MAIYSNLANKAAAFRSCFEEPTSQDNTDLDDGGGEGSSTRDTTPQPNTMEVRISGALAPYTKV